MLASVLGVGHDDGEPVQEPIGHRRLGSGRAVGCAPGLRGLVRLQQRLVHDLVTDQVLVPVLQAVLVL